MREGLVAAVAIAGELGGSELGVAVPAAGNLMGTVEQILGAARVAALARHGHVRIGELELILVTHRRPPPRALPVLACFTSTAQTHELARSPHVTALVYVPWADEERSVFLAAFPQAQLLSADVGDLA